MQYFHLVVLIFVLCVCGNAHAGIFDWGDESESTSTSGAEANAEATAGAGAAAGVFGSGNSESFSDVEFRSNIRNRLDVDTTDVNVNGQGQGIEAFNDNTTIVEPVDLRPVQKAAKELAKHAEQARAAAAVADGCDTAGTAGQSGLFGISYSRPTFPCEIARTMQVVALLREGGKFDRYVLRPLAYTRLGFMGIVSIVPIIGN